jgi:hypothetical protein
LRVVKQIIIIYRTIILPAVLYGCETWSLTIREEHSSSSIIRMVKSRRMRWAGHVARMGRRVMHKGYWGESQKERDRWEDQDVDGWTIL